MTESVIGNRYLWQGREFSWATGLYFHRTRWYDPVTGRFLSKDPIGISGGLNQYVFCGNNPVNFVDPWGLCEDQPWYQDTWDWFNDEIWWYVPKSWDDFVDDPSWTPETLAFVAPAFAAPEIGMAGISAFGRLGSSWHFGVEYGPKMNIIHVGNHIRYGVHVAVGAVAPYVADIHVYFQRAFPFFRPWRPGS